MTTNLPGKLNITLRNPEKMDVSSSPTHDGPIRIDSFHVRTDVSSRFATTVITNRLTNTSRNAEEVAFSSRLPEAAFITDFTMQIGDKLVHGEVKEKRAAKESYDRAKSKGHSAGHVFQKTRETEIFTISTNVAPNTEVIFALTYQEILQRIHGVYKHVINLDLDQVQPTSDVRIEVEIKERGKIVRCHVPKLGPKMGEKTNLELLKCEADPSAVIKCAPDFDDSGVSTCNVSYHISPSDLKTSGAGQSAAQFVLLYDLERQSTGGQIQILNGYFVHFFAPDDGQLEAISKHVVFVLDKSGSMSGRKMQQTKDAMRRILGDLRKGDTFNIVWFSDSSHIWRKKSVRATSDNVMKAISDVERMNAEGSTNIHDAIFDGLNLLSVAESSPTASMIVFMTDGQANAGPVHQSDGLVKAIGGKNRDSKFIIHTLSFGNDADFDMLQRIAAGNNGLACKIHEDLDADVQLIGFYQQISSPLLSDVRIEYTQGSVDLDSLVYDHTSTYYRGGEMMIVGRLNELRLDDRSIEARIEGRGRSGLLQMIPSCCYFPREPKMERLTTEADKDAGRFVERMWAYKTIKKLLKESQLSYCTPEEKDGKRKEALRLSLKYRFVTELTSMVVVEEDLKRVDTSDRGSMEMERGYSRYASSRVGSTLGGARGGGGFGGGLGMGGAMRHRKACRAPEDNLDDLNSIGATFPTCMSSAAFTPPPPQHHQQQQQLPQAAPDFACFGAAPGAATNSPFGQPASGLFGATLMSSAAFTPQLQQQATQGFSFGSVAPGATQNSLFGGQSATGMFGAQPTCLPPSSDFALKCEEDDLSFHGSKKERRRMQPRASRSRSPPPTKPISYLIVLVQPPSMEQSTVQEIDDYIKLLIDFFRKLFESNRKQSFVIRLISIDSRAGRSRDVVTLSNQLPDFGDRLKQSVNQGFGLIGHQTTNRSADDQWMRDQSNELKIEDIVARNDDAIGEKRGQIWMNPEDISITSGPLAEVFDYLNKVIGYDYIARDQLE